MNNNYRWEDRLEKILSSRPAEEKYRIVESPNQQYTVLFATEWSNLCECDGDERCTYCVENHECTFYRVDELNQPIEMFKVERATDRNELQELPNLTFGVEFLTNSIFIISTHVERLDVCKIEDNKYKILHSHSVDGLIEDVMRVNDQRYFLLKTIIPGFQIQTVSLYQINKLIANEKDFQVRLYGSRSGREFHKEGMRYLPNKEIHPYEYVMEHHKKLQSDQSNQSNQSNQSYQPI